MRSSPQSGFSVAMRRIKPRSSTGMGGRPGLDLYRHSSRHPARCQRTTVSGRTTMRQERQSHNLDKKLRLTRVAASMRRGFTPRSMKSPSWRRSIRFSASSDHRGLIASTAKPTRSANDRRTI